MNYDSLLRKKECVPLTRIHPVSFDLRAHPVDHEHVNTIKALLRLSEKPVLKVTPIISLDGLVLRSRQGLVALTEVIKEDNLPAEVDVEILPIRALELSQEDEALLAAWSANFDLDADTAAQKLLSYRDQYDLVKRLLRAGLSKPAIRKSLPKIDDLIMDDLLRKAPSAVLQDQAVAAARRVIEGKGEVSRKEAFLLEGLDPKNPKHVSKYEGHYNQMTKGSNLNKGTSCIDDGHIFQMYERSGDRYVKAVASHTTFWHNSYLGETGNPSSLPGHVYLWGQQIPFSSVLWRKLLDLEQAKIDAAQARLNDARSRMEQTVGGSLKNVAKAFAATASKK